MPSLPNRATASSAEVPALNPEGDLIGAKGHCEAPERMQAYFETLESARGCRQLVVIKGHPDPDSIASALAQRYLGRFFDIESTIVYFDEISHPENRALVKALEADLRQYREDMDLGAFDYMSFVDTQSPHLPVRVAKLPPILTFVDHHKMLGGFEAEFVDIREDCGATSSIYAEYMEHSAHGLRHGSAELSRLATALMHGIRSDTDNLLLAQPIDYRAGAYVRQYIDQDLLRLVSKQSITARTMDIIQRGLNNKVIKGTFLLAGVGFVREEDRDGIAQTADFLMRHEGVETAMVFGIVNGDVVDGSLRTSSATIDPDAWLKALFGADSAGRHYGGGRRNKGGFRIPLGLFARCRDREALWGIGKKTIEDLVFEKIGVEQAQHEKG
ncbi:MAG: DHH family phosphoesterase [Myxococcales bacterium]|nr:DHH family phosphoesterase [Myxococcales bacterium]MCB9521872.1 DHH family phosphoesterase [Myxococcales bacterium]